MNSFVCGASQGIGLAIVKELIVNSEINVVYASYRASSDIVELKYLNESYPKKLILVELDIKSEASIVSAAKNIATQVQSIDLLINCVGFLYNDKLQPEKSISEVSLESLTHSFEVNSVPTLLLAKHFKNLLQKSANSVFITLSAKVGSIEDNKIGGWYSYRVSKAALNMCIKNISIEFNRMGKKCTVMSIHPGTTETQLSKPFLSNASKIYKIHKPKESALNILKIAFNSSNSTHNGNFYSWNGEHIPW